jgi:hypothetical protein
MIPFANSTVDQPGGRKRKSSSSSAAQATGVVN